ncbi:Polycystin-2 [Diplonema papillatum]|nr:Polycystin-2 [Diplonema papillatum]
MASFLNRDDIKELRREYKEHRRGILSPRRSRMSFSGLRTENEMIEMQPILSQDRDATRSVRYPPVERSIFFGWLRDIETRRCDAEHGPDSKEARHLQKKLLDIENSLAAHSHIDVEAFIRHHEGNLSARFDVAFCEHQHKVALDTLSLFLYVPFVLLFAYFLVQGKGLEHGYWMNHNIEEFFLGQEFENSDDLRFVKTFWDIGSEDEFWEFVEGPLVSGLWPDDSSPASDPVQLSMMPIGGVKVRQLRVKAETCSSRQTRLFENEVDSFMRTADGADYIRSRLRDFHPQCYPELSYSGDNTDDGPYRVVSELHDGIQEFSMNSTANPSGWSGSLRGTDGLPPMFVETVFLRDEMVPKADRVALEAYHYHSCDALNSSGISIIYGERGTYHCDGHGFSLPYSWTGQQVRDALGVLKDGVTANFTDPSSQQQRTKQVPWIDAQTRALSFHVIFYAKNVNLFGYGQFLVEVTAAGAWIPVKQFSSFELFDFDSFSWPYFFFVAVFFLYIVAFWISWTYSFIRCIIDESEYDRTIWGILKAVCRSFFRFWVVFDFLNLLFFVVAWAFRMRTWTHGTTDQSILQREYYPDQYEAIAMEGQLASFISAANALLTFCRTFYFLQLHPQLNVLTKTVHTAAADLVGIVVIFVIVFTAFSLVTYVEYGLVVGDFRSVPQTIVTLCRMLIGDFDYETLVEERRIMTPIIFVLFNAFAVFILLNMVIAILDEAFGKVQQDKYLPSKLLTLMNSSDDPVFRYRGKHNRKNQAMGILFQNAFSKELTWWCRRAYLEFLVLTNQYKRTDVAWQTRLQYADRRSPRVYWKQRLADLKKNMKTFPFHDKCRLITRRLEDMLMDKFGKDFQLLVDSLVFEPCKAMCRKPSKYLLAVLHFHHLWKIEVEAITQTGKTVKELKELQEKKREAELKRLYLRQQEKFKEESREDTKRRLRAKYGRDPTTEEIISEITMAPPDNQQDIEKLWQWQIRRLHQITETITKLAETRDRNFSSGGPKLKFTEWMIEKVSEVTKKHLADTLCRIVQEEVQQEMTVGDPNVREEDRENMLSVLMKWRNGFYDALRKKAKEPAASQDPTVRLGSDTDASPSAVHSPGPGATPQSPAKVPQE